MQQIQSKWRQNLEFENDIMPHSKKILLKNIETHNNPIISEFRKMDHSTLNFELTKRVGDIRKQVQHTLDPWLSSSTSLCTIEPVVWV